MGQNRTDVKTAFLDRVEDTQLEPPSPPNPPRPLNSVENGSRHAGGQVVETMPAPVMESHAISAEEFYCGECYRCQEGVDPCPVCPVAGGWQRHWVTHIKPRMQASHWGYPEYFDERPFGTYVLQAEQMQASNGLRDQQVLYSYDFYPGDRSAMLTPRGEYQLRKIIQRMEMVPCPIVIQTAITDPKLDEARKQSVLVALRAAGVPAAPDMVVVDHPPLPGLQGLEGGLIYGNLLRQTHDRGGGFNYENGGGFGAPINIGNVSFGPTGQ